MGGSRSFRSAGFGCLIGRIVGFAGLGRFMAVWVMRLLSLRNRRNRHHLTGVVGLFRPALAKAKTQVFLLLFLLLG